MIPVQLTEMYATAIQTDSYSMHSEFILELLKNNDPHIMDYHYSLLKHSSENIDLHRRLCRAFEQRGKAGINYLLSKVKPEPVAALKADIIHILGKVRTPDIVPIALFYLKNEERILRYKSTIVLGWNGSKNELSSLYERLLNEPDNELRSFAATAMRQIWHNHKNLKTSILQLYLLALEREDNEEVNAAIISCTQDMILKKLGLKETQYGEIIGDVKKAKDKAIKAVNDFLKSNF